MWNIEKGAWGTLPIVHCCSWLEMRYNWITAVAANCLPAHLLPQGWRCRSLQNVKPGSWIQLDVICVSNQHSPASHESLQKPRLVTQILREGASPAYQSLLLRSFGSTRNRKEVTELVGCKCRSQAGCVWEEKRGRMGREWDPPPPPTEGKGVGSGRPLRVIIGGASTFRGDQLGLTCFFPLESTGRGGTRKRADEVRLWLE